MHKFRVVVAGGRKFSDFNKMITELDNVLRNKAISHKIVIVYASFFSLDQLGERYAKLRGYEVQVHEADWKLYQKAAGYRRNEVMANNSDASVVFWDGKSVGSKHMIDLTKSVGNPVRVVSY